MSKALKTYREIIQAMLDGDTVQCLNKEDSWTDLHDTPIVRIDSLNDRLRYTYRIKPRTIMIGDMEVPEPVRDVSELEKGEDYYSPSLVRERIYNACTWDGDDFDLRGFKRGMIHKTKEAAVLHAKALMKISGGSCD